MCLAEYERAPNTTRLTLQACQVCTKCPTPPANCQPPTDTPLQTPPHLATASTRPTTTLQTRSSCREVNSPPAMLPSKKRRQRRRHRRSNKVDLGFHPESIAQGHERGRISSVTPPTRKQHPQALSSPAMSRTFVRRYCTPTPGRCPARTPPSDLEPSSSHPGRSIACSTTGLLKSRTRAPPRGALHPAHRSAWACPDRACPQLPLYARRRPGSSPRLGLHRTVRTAQIRRPSLTSPRQARVSPDRARPACSRSRAPTGGRQRRRDLDLQHPTSAKSPPPPASDGATQIRLPAAKRGRASESGHRECPAATIPGVGRASPASPSGGGEGRRRVEGGMAG